METVAGQMTQMEALDGFREELRCKMWYVRLLIQAVVLHCGLEICSKDTYNDPFCLPCNHNFCKHCVDELDQTHECPVCNLPFWNESVGRNHTLANIVKAWATLDQDVRKAEALQVQKIEQSPDPKTHALDQSGMDKGQTSQPSAANDISNACMSTATESMLMTHGTEASPDSDDMSQFRSVEEMSKMPAVSLAVTTSEAAKRVVECMVTEETTERVLEEETVGPVVVPVVVPVVPVVPVVDGEGAGCNSAPYSNSEALHHRPPSRGGESPSRGEESASPSDTDTASIPDPDLNTQLVEEIAATAAKDEAEMEVIEKRFASTGEEEKAGVRPEGGRVEESTYGEGECTEENRYGEGGCVKESRYGEGECVKESRYGEAGCGNSGVRKERERLSAPASSREGQPRGQQEQGRGAKGDTREGGPDVDGGIVFNFQLPPQNKRQTNREKGNAASNRNNHKRQRVLTPVVASSVVPNPTWKNRNRGGVGGRVGAGRVGAGRGVAGRVGAGRVGGENAPLSRKSSSGGSGRENVTNGADGGTPFDDGSTFSHR
jgi:hypothetical protein